MLNNKLSFNLPVLITKQNKRFVAYTPALDISTSAKTEKGVKKRFSDLVGIFLEEIIEEKTVDDVLSELGWKKIQKQWAPPKIISSHSIGLKFPVIA